MPAAGALDVSTIKECPHPEELRTADPQTSELYCTRCGAIVSGPSLIVSDGSSVDREHPGRVQHERMPIVDMGRKIPAKGWKDPSGRRLSRYQQRINKQISERRQQRALELVQYGRRLGFSEHVVREADLQYRRLARTYQFRGFPNDVTYGALYWLVLKEVGVPEPLSVFLAKIGHRHRSRSFNRAVSHMKRILKIGLGINHPRIYLERVRGNIDPAVIQIATRLCDAWNNALCPMPTTTPVVVAAGSVYAAAKHLKMEGNGGVQQRRVADLMGVTEVSIRNVMPHLEQFTADLPGRP